MQICDLVKTLDNMTDAELLEYVRAIRHRREVIRPAAKARVERAEKKTTRAKVNKVSGLVEAMSEEDRLKLITLLQEGNL